jgi:drug/metabolite transporter (DMT)-like permease
MAKIFVILIVAAIIESIGVAILSGGIKEINKENGGAGGVSVSSVARIVKAGFTNGKVILGVGLEAVFFGCLLYMLSQKDVSLIWPLTSLGFIFTTLAAVVFLGEKVSWVRWTGVMLIAVGAGLTSYSEAAKQNAAPPPEAASTPIGPR